MADAKYVLQIVKEGIPLLTLQAIYLICVKGWRKFRYAEFLEIYGM